MTVRIPAKPTSKSADRAKLRGKVRRHHDRLRAPDVDSESFRREAHRQSLAVAQTPQDADDQAFVDAISEWNDE